MTSKRWTRALVALAAIVAMAIPTSSAGAVAAHPVLGASAPVIGSAMSGPAGASFAAPAADPDAVSLSGTLRVAIADDFAAGRSQTLYSIEDAAGSTPITVSGSGLEKLDGAAVRVSGRRLADGSVAVAAAAVVVVKTAAANPAAAALGLGTKADKIASPAAAKNETIAVVIADYSDLSGYPVTVAQAQSTFTSAVSSVHSYFNATSRGRLSTTTTVLGPWHLGVASCPWSFGGSLNAMLAYAKAHGVSLASYNHVVLWTKAPCGQSWAGIGYVPGQYVQMIVDWPTYGDATSAAVASHELEHNLGLYHSNGLSCVDGSGDQVSLSGSCQDAEYWDRYTTMGDAGWSDYALLDADRLASLGWLDAGESQTPTSVGTYSLVPVYSATPGVRLLRLTRPTPVLAGEQSGSWTLEIRSTLTGTAFDQFGASAIFSPVTTGVTIRYSEDEYRAYNVQGPSFLIDTVPDATAANPGVDFWDSPLQVGQTFSDPTGGFTITVNSAGPSGASVTIGDTMAPTAPFSLEGVSIPTGGAQLDWQAATDNLGLAHYRIYRDGSQVGEVSGSTLTFTDPPAGVGGLHTYTVTAVDTAGLEGASAAVDVTLISPPSAPLSATATPGNGGAQISWSPPAQGAPITGYTVTSNPLGLTCTTTVALSCIIGGLTNGQSYTFAVTATNSVGTGPAATAGPVTPLPVPGRPTGVTGVAGVASVAVTWTAPADSGSNTITGYTVTSSPGARTCPATNPAIGCTVTSLTNGVPYTFTVTATSATGTGLPSVPSAPVTPRTRPDAPVAVTALASDQSASVSWSAPPFNGGSPVTAYDVVSTPDGLTCHSTGPRTCRVNGLTNRVTYTFKVTATTVAGTGDPSAASPGVMPLKGATYVTVTPNRLVDSRSGATRTGLSASLSNKVPVSFQVTDRSADSSLNIPGTAVAVTGNLTAVNEGSGGYFSLTPSTPVGTPTTSTLNFPKGDIRANAVTVPLGAGGILWITFVGATGAKADVIFDVTGYFTGNTSGATYKPLTPNRILDSRSPTRLGMGASLANLVPASFQVTGRSADSALNVPSNAVAVVGNLTAVNESSNGYVSLTPIRPVGAPTTSTINFTKGDTRANAVTVPLGAGGVLWATFKGATGAHADVIFDVTGYFAPDTSGATYVALTPNRLVDSRATTPPLGLASSLVSKVPAQFAVTGQSIDPLLNVPADAVGVTGNLTAVGESSRGYLSLTPEDPAGVFSTSTLNFPKGDTRANAVMIPLGSGGKLWVTFVGATGAHADAIFDVAGYFTMN